jgi:hypothetical protein
VSIQAGISDLADLDRVYAAIAAEGHGLDVLPAVIGRTSSFEVD